MVMVVVVIAKLKLNLKMVVFCHMCQAARNIEPFFTLWRFNLKMHHQDCFLQCDWYRGDGQNEENDDGDHWWLQNDDVTSKGQVRHLNHQDVSSRLCVWGAHHFGRGPPTSYCPSTSRQPPLTLKLLWSFQTGSCIVYLSPDLPMMVSLGHKTGTQKSSALVCMAGPRFWNCLQLQPLPKGDITIWCFEMYSRFSTEFHWRFKTCFNLAHHILNAADHDKSGCFRMVKFEAMHSIILQIYWWQQTVKQYSDALGDEVLQHKTLMVLTLVTISRALCPEGVVLRGLDSLASASIVVVAVPRWVFLLLTTCWCSKVSSAIFIVVAVPR